MKLVSFRIQKYKRIDDTDYIEVGKFAGFIGKNEVGKSSLFRALSKLNPSDGEKFDKRIELPYLEYEELKNETVIPVKVRFELEETDEFETDETETDETETDETETDELPKEIIIGKDYDDEFHILDTDEKLLDISDNVRAKIINAIPHFIYFDQYATLQGSFNLVNFQKELNANPDDPKLIIKKCIFDYTELEPAKLNDLRSPPEESDEQQDAKVDERERLCDIAAAKLNNEFKDWWKEEGYVFHFRVDDKTFQIRISDNKDKYAKIELQYRSKGLQYFFSFFIIFLVESKRGYSNSILLLDEPGLHFHGKRQMEFLKLFKKLSEKNQFYYTTHSPFLVDTKDDFANVRVVYSDKKTGKTIVAPKGTLPDNDDDAIYPLEMNWYLTKFQNYIKRKPHVLVEGETDVCIFEKINELMQKKNPECFIESVEFMSTEGDSMPMFLIKLLKKLRIKTVFFVDGDTAGLEREKKFTSDYMLEGFNTKKYVRKESSTEDLFPEKTYMQAFEKIYKKPTSDLNKEIPMITKRLENYLNKEFKKMPVTIQLLKIIERSDEQEILEKFKPLFTDLKKLIDKP